MRHFVGDNFRQSSDNFRHINYIVISNSYTKTLKNSYKNCHIAMG